VNIKQLCGRKVGRWNFTGSGRRDWKRP